MESKKRLVCNVAPSETSLRPMKKRRHVKVGENGSQGLVASEKAMTDVIMEDSKSTPPSRDLTSEMRTFGVSENEKPSVITPLNSFHELRHVSEVYEASLTPLRLEQAKAVSDDSSEGSRDSPVFQFSVEAKEDFVAPLHTVVFGDSPRRVAMAELCEATQSGASHETCIEKKEAPPKRLSSLVEKFEQRNSLTWTRRALISIVSLFVVACFLATPTIIIEDPGSIYVPGGGFSGFWFTLGRLSSIDDPRNKTYYCYSAGCLGVTAMLSNITMESAYEYAVGAQKRWQRGELSRYDVTETFINGLLYGSEDTGEVTTLDPRPAFLDPKILSTLRIITSERNGSRGVKASIRTPHNADELKEMLLQTAWIPFALSRGLWHNQHMDGAFTLHEHPQCPTNLGYGLDWDIVLNALNVNLGYDKVTLLWEKGLKMGI